MSLIVYRRLSGGPSPARELLEVDDEGAWTGWRSRARVVGRFGGRFDAGPVAGLVMAAGAAPVPEAGRRPPDGTYERVIAAGTEIVVHAGDTLHGPWGTLLDWCRQQISAMTDDPGAAIATLGLVVRLPRHIRLEHGGPDVLPLELGSLAVRAGSAQGRPPATTAPAVLPSLQRVDAGPGWSLDLDVPGLAPAPGDTVTAWAELVVEDAGVYVPVALVGSATAG